MHAPGAGHARLAHEVGCACRARAGIGDPNPVRSTTITPQSQAPLTGGARSLGWEIAYETHHRCPA
ncbi:hypothetical protein GALL_259740 [mine drainage metagenome]|uniref:Uncharacterized protein n=1 Tax=mine drainage metagenome TaxID=410659 RepID=A0A1J5R8E6_9ZZZZ